jgi:hypothetical protein
MNSQGSWANERFKMSDNSQKVEKPVNIRRGLFSKVNDLLITIYDLVFHYESDQLGYIDEKAKKIKAENLDADVIASRLALAEAKVAIYETYLDRLTKSVTELNILEITPTKAGKKRDELAFIVAWDIYDTYFEEHEEYPTSEKLSILTSERLGEILGREPMDEDANYLLPRSTARDYITRFKKITGGN